MQGFLRYAAATAQAALAKGNSIPNLSNVGLGERRPEFDGASIWALYDGIKRDDETAVSIFVYDCNAPVTNNRTDRKTLLVLAKNALKKLRALRHPDILRYVDGSETETAVYIVTEQIVPLITRIGREGNIKPNSEAALEAGTSDEWRVWGLSKLVSALAFINEQGKSTHGNLNVNSVFVTPGGEWKIGGFELLTGPNDSSPILYTHSGFVPDAAKYAPPEAKKGGYAALQGQDPHALDSYHLYLFLQVLFNGPLPFSASPDTPIARGNIPPALFPHYRRLFVPNGSPNSRLKAATFLALGNALDPPGFFKTNRLVQLADGLDSFALAGESEKAALMRNIKDSLAVNAGKNRLPTEFLQWKVLPALIKAFELGSGAPALLPIILTLGEHSTLNTADYDKHILQPVVRAFASPDRAMRMALLDALPSFVEKLENKTVTDKVWPNLLTGFTDVVPVIREATVKSILPLAPKLSDRILNNELLRLLAKAQTDSEAGIRTNTCILLGRLSKYLSAATNSKVLIPAFSRAMRDPFVHARMAGLMALMATIDCFSKEDVAGRVIPSMSITLVDKEKIVRDQGYKAIDLFVKKLEKMVAGMPETVLQPADATNMNGHINTSVKSTAAGDSAPGMANTAAGAATALAGWVGLHSQWTTLTAFTSFAKRLAASDLQTGIGGQSMDPVTPMAGPSKVSSTQPVILLPTRNLAPSTPTNGISRSNSHTGTSHSADPVDSGDWSGDLMQVDDGGDWDALDPFPDEVAADPPEQEADHIEQDAFIAAANARLSSFPSKTPPPPKSTRPIPKKASNAASKSAVNVDSDDFDNASWDLDGTELSVKPSVKSASPVNGWNDPPVTHFPKSNTSKISKKAAQSHAATSSITVPAIDNPWANSESNTSEGDGWGEFDKVTSATDEWAATPRMAPTAPPPSTGKSKVAQMREERKARLAALRNVQAPPPSSAAPPTSNTSTNEFTSGANTAYRF